MGSRPETTTIRTTDTYTTAAGTAAAVSSGGASPGLSPGLPRRASISQTDLRDLRHKAKRFAKWAGRRRAAGVERDDTRGVDGLGEYTGGVLSSADNAEKALRGFREAFMRLDSSIAAEWDELAKAQELPPLLFDDVRRRIESYLDRVDTVARRQGRGGEEEEEPATPGMHWQYTNARITTLEKLNTWIAKSVHPLFHEVHFFLWKGIEIVFDQLTRPEGFSSSALDAYCSALHELTLILPSSLYYVSEKAVLEDEIIKGATGHIYADIFDLVASATRDVTPHVAGQPQGFRHHVHFSPRNTSLSDRPYTSGTAKPTGSILKIGRKPQILKQWRMQLKTILEQVGYHSKLLHSELSMLQQKEQSARFENITRLFDEADKAADNEKECKRKLRDLEQRMDYTPGSQEHVEQGQPRRNSDSSSSSDGNRDVAEIPGLLDLDPHNFEHMNEIREKLVRDYREARTAKLSAFDKLLAEAGHIKCDVCVYTAYEDTGAPEDNHERDYDVSFSSTLRTFTDLVNGMGASKRKTSFRLYITNENTVDALSHIDPQFVLDSKGKQHLAEGPNLWSLSNTGSKLLSKSNLANKAYFYDTTWKIYWSQPRGGDSKDACPVAVLVLPADDVPLSRPVDPSPQAQSDFEKGRYELVQYYRHRFHKPLKERGTAISADDLSVQILSETKRRWREVLDKMRHFVDVLTNLLYVAASNSTVEDSEEAMEYYNQAAGQVFKILIKVNSYESMFIETMSFLSQLAETDMFLGSSKADLLQLLGEEDDDDDAVEGMHRTATMRQVGSSRSLSRTGMHPGLSTSMSGLHMPRKVNWRDVKRGHQDLMDNLKASKRQAESLKSIIDHQHSMHESRLANRHAVIANFHAAEATRQADEAAKQNASMRRMTVLTFVFLPMMFIAALFGVNVKEMGQGSISIWIFFVVAVPFAGCVLASWAFLEFRRLGTESGGMGTGMVEEDVEMGEMGGSRDVDGQLDSVAGSSLMGNGHPYGNRVGKSRRG
ncbi:hypothetical protein BDZ91DRAFT_737167 [Kalaharituber pfeilii]|nr:hypothetical protein BDZ91DRAFT_737167 [Kalaharituber pfeilii]